MRASSPSSESKIEPKCPRRASSKREYHRRPSRKPSSAEIVVATNNAAMIQMGLCRVSQLCLIRFLFWHDASDASAGVHRQNSALVQQRDYWKNTRHSLVSRALLFRCFFLVWPVVVGRFPGLVRIIFIHALERLESILPQIFFINDPVRANHKGLHSGYPVFSRRRR